MDLSEPTPTTRVGDSQHLADLQAEVDRLAARLRTPDSEARTAVVCGRADAATLATLRLDGSPLTSLPSLEAAAPSAAPPPDARDGRGSWFEAMRALEDEPDERLQALEIVGARAGFGSDDLARALVTDTRATLEELHRRLTHGLVADERAGRPRRVAQAVHDASTGRILYFTSEPEAIAGELSRLGAWMGREAAGAHPLVASGVLHLEVLRVHPFDAANGRLARAAARLVLRAGGRDPDGLACPEPELAADSLGYHEEVARTARRRDATIFVERWGEAVADGLRASAAELGLLDDDVPERGRGFLAGLEADAFTVADYREATGAGATEARGELQQLLEAGAVARVPGSRGLRYRVTGVAPG